MVSGANAPQTGTTGSGIYLGRKRIQATLTKPYPIRELFVAKVPKNIRADVKFEQPQIRKESSPAALLRLYVNESWEHQNSIIYPIVEPQETICVENNKLCCTVQVKRKYLPVPEGASSYNYMLTVNYTKKLYIEKRNVGEITCAIIACTGETTDTCGGRFHLDNEVQRIEFEHIKITTKIHSDQYEEVMVIPNIVPTRLSPFDVSNFTLSEIDVSGDPRCVKISGKYTRG